MGRSFPQQRLRRAAILVLAAGLSTAGAIYLTATDPAENELVAGFRTSKAYRHDLEAYGGKLNVVAGDLGRWFESLWQGEGLAGTVAVLTVALAALLWYLSRPLPPPEDPMAPRHG